MHLMAGMMVNTKMYFDGDIQNNFRPVCNIVLNLTRDDMDYMGVGFVVLFSNICNTRVFTLDRYHKAENNTS